MKLGWFWNQWLVGLMYDEGRMVPERWLVFILGPLTVSISLGRGERHLLPRR